MKILIFIILVFCSSFAYSQTWTEISGFGGKHTEWTVISREQWNRIRLQRVEDSERAELLYIDSFDMEMGKNKVISGTRPSFNGYYYLYGKSSDGEVVVAYGNPNTGRMEIRFITSDYSYEEGCVQTNSNQYTTLYNRFIRRVNGE